MEMIVIVIIRIAAVYIAYRIGIGVGAMRERERLLGLEARIRQQIETVAKKDRELWEMEIDA